VERKGKNLKKNIWQKGAALQDVLERFGSRREPQQAKMLGKDTLASLKIILVLDVAARAFAPGEKKRPGKGEKEGLRKNEKGLCTKTTRDG